MTLFILTFFSIYGGAQAYLGWRIASTVLPKRRPVRMAWTVWLMLMTFALFITRRLETADWFRCAQAIGLVGSLWMAMTLWFVVAALPMDLWNLLVRLAAWIRPGLRAARIPPVKYVAVVCVLVAALVVYGSFEAGRIRIAQITVASSRLPADAKPVRLMQISDVHLGLHGRRRRIRRIVELARELQPDVLVSTGDLVDGAATHLAELAPLWHAIDPPLGKYAVLGNHEYYVGEGDSVVFHEAAGFRLLRGTSVTVGDHLLLAGVDDPTGRSRASWRGEPHLAIDDLAASGRARILLKHQPVIEPGTPDRFDLMLSGHTHGGQIFPFGWLVRRRYPFFVGRYEAGAMTVCVSPGAGTWGPPLRVLARPRGHADHDSRNRSRRRDGRGCSLVGGSASLKTSLACLMEQLHFLRRQMQLFAQPSGSRS